MNNDKLSNFTSYCGEPTICSKIDALTIIFNNCSIVDVLSVIGLTDVLSPDYVEVFNSRYLSSQGYGTNLRIAFDNILMDVKIEDVLTSYNLPHYTMIDSIDPMEFFDHRLPYIRLDMMGTALDYLRSSGIDIDSLVFVPFDDMLPPEGSYHFTRVDYAFDLLDYKPDFLKLCKSACHLYQSLNYRISIKGSRSGVAWSERNGDQDTLYLGKSGSDRLLRIYDKKRQYTNSNRYVSDCPFSYIDSSGDVDVPFSWIRIEFQVRDEKLNYKLLYGQNACFLGIFKHIYDHYAIREGQGVDVPICSFWDDLFDWNVIPDILTRQNANCVVYKNPFERATNYLEKIAKSSIIQVISQVGIRSFILWIEREMEFMQSQPSESSPNRRFQRIKDKMLFSNDGSYPDSIIVDKRTGHLRLKRDFADLVPLSEVHYL